MPAKNDREFVRFAFLDYLRVFAVVSVMAQHIFLNEINAESTNRDSILYWPANIMALFSSEGVPGVVVFFLISGYIITHILQTESCFKFLIKRTFRIYPLFLVALVTDCLLDTSRGIGYVFSADFIPHALLLGDFFGLNYGLGGVEWTLRIEMVFYIVMAILKCSGSVSHYVKILPTSIFILALTIYCLQKIVNDRYLVDISSFSQFILLGCFFYMYEIGKVRIKMLFIYIFFTCTAYFFPMPMHGVDIYGSNFYFHNPSALLAVMVFSLAWIFRDKIKHSVFIESASLITYPLYLFHVTVIWSIVEFLEKYNIWVVSLKGCAVLLLLALCFVLHHAIEQPMNRIGRRIAAMV